MEREELISALGLEADATDEEIAAALKAALDAFTDEDDDDGEGSDSGESSAAEGENRASSSSRADASDGEEQDIDAIVSSAVDRALSQRDNEQAIQALVDQAVNDGKIEPAEREIYLASARLKFDKTKERLDALEKGRVLDGKMKTSSASRSRPSITGQSKAAEYVRSQMQ